MSKTKYKNSQHKYQAYYEMFDQDTQTAVDTVLEAERLQAIRGMNLLMISYSMLSELDVNTDDLIDEINHLKDELVKVHPEWSAEQVEMFYKI